MVIEQIAIGVLINSDNRVLIAKRASDKHMGDKWEFPGGKVEKGETSQDALCREMHEELGIDVRSMQFLMDVTYEYDDKKVILDVYKIEQWFGEVQGMEQQPLRWIEKHELKDYEFPAANAEIIRQIQ